MLALGFTVTITLNAALPHAPVGGTGVTVKLAVNGIELVLLITPLINVRELPVCPALIVNSAGKVGFVQLYNVFAGTILPCCPLVGLTVNVAPVHIVVVKVPIVAFGFTVTTIVNCALLVQPEVNTGVTV